MSREERKCRREGQKKKGTGGDFRTNKTPRKRPIERNDPAKKVQKEEKKKR